MKSSRSQALLGNAPLASSACRQVLLRVAVMTRSVLRANGQRIPTEFVSEREAELPTPAFPSRAWERETHDDAVITAPQRAQKAAVAAEA